LSGAISLFEQFKSGGIGLLSRLVEEEWQEDLLLEFKTIEGSCAPMAKPDRKNFAIALSGFANSDGGVIVWGVDARSGGPDEPHGWLTSRRHQSRPTNG